MTHNFAAVFVVCKVISQRSVAGLSWHTAVLYALVFSTREPAPRLRRRSPSISADRGRSLLVGQATWIS